MMYLLAIWGQVLLLQTVSADVCIYIYICIYRCISTNSMMYIYISFVAHAQVSEWRHGEVAEAELAGTVVIEPLAGQGSQAQPSAEANSHAEEEEQEEDEEEGADFLQLHAALFRHRRICPITHARRMYVHQVCHDSTFVQMSGSKVIHTDAF